MGAQVNFEITDNAPWAFPWRFEDANGTGIDYTGSTFKLQVRTSASAASAVLTLESSAGITHDDLTAGEITVTFPVDMDVGEYVQDLVRLEAGVAKELMWSGTLIVEDGVTEV